MWRPADTVETLVAWAAALQRRDGPTALLLSRQNVPFLADGRDAGLIRRGGYTLAEAAGGATRTRVVLIATGSELPLAVGAQKALQAAGVPVRVVSMPSTTVFDRQAADYKSSVLPDGVPRIAIEAGVTDFWWKYVRAEGAVVGIDHFGESAPAADLFKHFGFTVDNVVATVNAVLAKGKKT